MALFAMNCEKVVTVLVAFVTLASFTTVPGSDMAGTADARFLEKKTTKVRSITGSIVLLE